MRQKEVIMPAKKKLSSRSNGVRSPSYPFLVVERMTGRVHAGAETRNDAEDMRHDLPTPAADLQVLTREGVRRKFGRISWASVATMRNPQRPSRRNGDEVASVSAKHFNAYKSALREPMGLSYNDSYNVDRYGITREQYGAIDGCVAGMVGHSRGDKEQVTLRQINSFLAGDKVFLARATNEMMDRVISAFRKPASRKTASRRNPQRPSRANGATFVKVTGDRARGSTVRGARHNYRTVEVLVYQSPNSMATARTYEIVTDASYNMGDGAYTTDVWKLPEPVAVQQAIYTAVRNLRGGGRNRRAPVPAE